MRDLAVVLVPVLMLVDYYLTLLAARLLGRTPGERAAYELNPQMRSAIGEGRLFNPGHLGAVAAVTVALVYVTLTHTVWLVDLFLGALIGAWVPLCGAHLSNILVALHVDRHRGDAVGHITTSERFRLTTAACNTLGVTVLPVLAVAMFEPTPFATGAAFGALMVALAPMWWRRRLAGGPGIETAAATGLACSFCDRDQHTVGRLLASRTATICDECVTTCAEALRAADVGQSAAGSQSGVAAAAGSQQPIPHPALHPSTA